jgi:tetratricopeptide (TPR) repeat protein
LGGGVAVQEPTPGADALATDEETATMSANHFSREQVLAVLRGERPPTDLVPTALAHLLELCPQCRAGFERFNAEMAERGELVVRSADRQAVLAAARRYRAPLARGREAAQGLLDRLLALPAAERLARVEGRGGDFRGPALADLLLEAAHARLPGDPAGSRELARLARAALQHERPSRLVVELYARAVAAMANGLRAEGELPAAEALFADARYLLRAEGGAERLVEAELDMLEASLRRAQRRFPEARELLARALTTYALEERRRETARALLNLSLVHREAGALREAIQAAEEALSLLDAAEEPQLALVAWHNLAYFHADLGEFAHARELLVACEPLFPTLPDAATRLRRLWLEANVSRGLGETLAAWAGYEEARQGFRRLGLAYDFALVSLDLARLYLVEGMSAEVQALAEEMVPLFEEREVHAEAAAALMLFVDATRSRQVSLPSVAELASYLEAARRDPALPFRPPA